MPPLWKPRVEKPLNDPRQRQRRKRWLQSLRDNSKPGNSHFLIIPGRPLPPELVRTHGQPNWDRPGASSPGIAKASPVQNNTLPSGLNQDAHDRPTVIPETTV
jgi:hypothetical protein